jgi:hypothetical protein
MDAYQTPRTLYLLLKAAIRGVVRSETRATSMPSAREQGGLAEPVAADIGEGVPR